MFFVSFLAPSFECKLCQGLESACFFTDVAQKPRTVPGGALFLFWEVRYIELDWSYTLYVYEVLRFCAKEFQLNVENFYLNNYCSVLYYWIILEILKFETKWNSIRKTTPSCNVTIDTDKIFERPLCAQEWEKAPLNIWHTHLCCCEARCPSYGNFMFPVLLNRGVRFMHLNELCEEWPVSVKCGQQPRKQTGSGGNILQHLGWFFKIILYQAKVDRSCHPNSHLHGTVQPTKHLLIIDHLKCIVSRKSLPKPLSLPTQSGCRFLFCSPGGKCSVLRGWGAPRRSPAATHLVLHWEHRLHHHVACF